MGEWVSATLSSRHDWANGLMTVRFDALRPQFTAGQFFNLALDIGERRVRRAYSAASAPGDALEFVISEVTAGQLTPSLFNVRPGEVVWVQAGAAGFFTLDFVPDGVSELWLIATGTGIGPYVSMLRSGALSAYERVIVVHGVRMATHLTYRDEFQQFVAQHPNATYLPVVTGKGERTESRLTARIPSLLASGELETAARTVLDVRRSHILLCGNPDMIRESIVLLEQRGLKRNRRREPGHITMEKYW